MPTPWMPLYQSTRKLSVRAHFPPNDTAPRRTSPTECSLTPTGIPLIDRTKVVRSVTGETPRVGEDPFDAIDDQ